MNPTLKVLYLEDNPADVELCRHALRQAGYEPNILHVDNRQAFVEGLADTFDVVLADYSLPQFDAFSALRLMQERGVDLPFIVVSGTVGEETAVDLIKQGADDYLLKDRLGRLGAAIEHARGQRRLKSERAAIERALRAQDRLFRAVVEHATEGLALLSKDLTLAYLSPTAESMVGMEMKDFPGLDPVAVVHPEDQARVREILQASIETPRTPQYLDVRIRRQDGTWRWVECTIDNRLDQTEVQGVVVNMRDVDGRRRAEEALRQSEENYRLLFSSNPQPMWVYDRDTLAILQVNDAAVHAYGYAADEFLRMTVLDLHPPEVRERLREVAATLPGRIRRPGIWPQVRKDGSGLEADITTHDLELEGRPARLVMAFDVTERERARGELEASERRYRELTEEAPIGIYRTAPDGRILFGNPALVRMLGYDDLKDLTARSLESGAFDASYSRAEFKGRLEAQGEIRGLEASWTRKDGSRLYIRENARVVRSQDGDGVYYEGTVEDITEQKQVQDELRRRSEQILLLYEAGRALGETLDLESLFDKTFQAVSRVMDCSGFYLSTFEPEPQLIRCAYARHGGRRLDASSFPAIPLEPDGQGTQSRVVRSGESLYLPDYRAYWRTAWTRFLVDENGIADAPASDEADIDRSALLVPLKLEEKVTGVVQVFSQQADAFQPDQMAFLEALAPQLAAAMANARLFRRAQEEIRERRQADQAMRQLSTFNESIIRNMAEGIVLEEPDGTFSFVNPAAAAMLGYRAEELLGQPFSAIMPADQVDLVRSANERRAQGVTDRYELVLLRKDRSRITVLVSGSPRFQDGEFAGTIAVFTDISELKAAQADVARRAEQLQALYQTTLEINAQPSLQTVLQAIVERATSLLRVQSGGLYLLRPDGETLEFLVVHGMLAKYKGTTLRRGEALSGKVLETGQTIVVEDYINWPGRSPLYTDTSFRRIVAVPLRVGKRIVGVLNAADMDKPGTFTPEEIRLAELFADQAAIAVEKARLLEETRRRAAHLEGVASVSAALRVAVDRQQMTDIIADQLVRLLDTPHVGIVLRGDPGHVAMAVGRGLAEPMVGLRGPADAGIAGYVLGGGATFESHQASRDERILHREIFRGADHVLAVPLAVQDEGIGMIVTARNRPFEDEEVRLLTAVAEMAGNAINRAGVMDTLEQRVAERTQDLESANVRLQDLDQLKSTFVSNVSHELRTPITNILLYLDLLEQPGREDRRPTYMGILRGESGRLHRLIEDLLTLSRLERGSMSLDLEPQVLDAIIAEVLTSQEARAHIKQIELAHDPNPDMPPAPLAHGPMVQVLTNLIGNAVAYAPSGATVTVQTRLERTRGERYATVRVHNSAPAIPPEDLPHLFERFYRGRSAAESGEAGTGLGLSICKEIVERHRGWIEVESAPETGTAFTVWLPLDLQ